MLDAGDSSRHRPRDLGLIIGDMPTGHANAITDVSGVRVGHVTLISGSGALNEGYGPVRTGVTAILPHSGNLFQEKVVGTVHTINGFGKAVGISQVLELGLIETPVVLTNTLAVGAAFDGLVSHALKANSAIGVTRPTVNPLVGECNDGALNDIRGRHVTPDHVIDAIVHADDGPVAEGAVGAGTGMTLFGWKGGIGTASRLVDNGDAMFTIGLLVLANYGRPEDLTIDGMRMARHFMPDQSQVEPLFAPDGSCVVVIATDCPLSSRQLGRLARRAQIGLARTGGHASHGSGEYVFAFSTARRVDHAPSARILDASELAEDGPTIDPMFDATIEACEESVLNALFTATDTAGINGVTRRGFPGEAAARLVRGREAS